MLQNTMTKNSLERKGSILFQLTVAHHNLSPTEVRSRPQREQEPGGRGKVSISSEATEEYGLLDCPSWLAQSVSS